MSAASELRLRGFEELIAQSSESVTYNGTDPVTALSAVVSYEEKKNAAILRALARSGRQINDDRTVSSIEFLKTALAVEPTVGSTFTNSDGRRHRIEKRPKTTDFTYICECEVSTPGGGGSSS